MIVPLLFLWESDATIRGALEQSQAGDLTGGGTSLMSGAGAELEASTREPEAAYGATLGGSYARVFAPEVMALGDTAGVPASDTVAASLGARASWGLTPRVQLDLDGAGFLASRLGVRAEDDLAARDPFAGERVQYATGPTASVSIVLTQRLLQRLSAGYLQEGALDAETSDAVGIDAHTGRGSAGWTWEMSSTDRLLPELRYTFVHFEHALLDVERTRGPADVHSGTAALGVARDFTRRLTGTAEGGATVASPPPVLDSDDPVIAPSARLGVTWQARPFRTSARYAYEYTTLGPRIGFGHEHEGALELAFRPKDGGRFRDFWITVVARMAYGTAPVGANPPLASDAGEPAPRAEGLVTTWTTAAGAKLVYPLGLGFAALGGVDLEHLDATFDPVPAAGDPGPSFRVVVTVGLGAAFSTDPSRTLPNVPREDDDARSAPAASRQERAPADAPAHSDDAPAAPPVDPSTTVPSWP